MGSEPPLILAFDTSAAHCAAVLVRGDAVLARRDETMDRGQAERLFPMLEELLAEAGARWSDLDGIGVSHGEGMGGMTPLERQQFVDEVYIAGALEAKRSRPVKLIHRVPFSSGLSSGPGVSKDVEQVTRAAMEKLDDQFDGPIWAEMKFNWSHGHSTPKLVKVHGGKLGDTYFEPLPANYKIVWQIRNEDFFALRWGVPDFIRQHVARNTAPYVGGYFTGSETYIPALDYFTASQEPVAGVLHVVAVEVDRPHPGEGGAGDLPPVPWH